MSKAGDHIRLALGALEEAGVDGDVYVQHRSDLELSVRDGELDGIQESDVAGIAVRAMKSGRLGFVHGSITRDSDAVTVARSAVAIAGAAGKRDDLVLAPPSSPPTGREPGPGDDGEWPDEGEALSLMDPSLESRSIESRVDWLTTAEQAARGMDPLVRRTEQCTLTESRWSIWLGNTRGLRRHFRRSRIAPSIEVVAERDTDKQPGTRSVAVTNWGEVPAPASFGREAAGDALRLLGAGPVRTRRVPIVFSPRTGWTPVAYVQSALDGDAIDRGRSWLAGADGTRIGSPLVTIRDDGRRPRAPGSAPFDGEGIDTRDTVLVDAGVVRGQLVDLATSVRTGLEPSGNATRSGYESLPAMSAHNLLMDRGDRSPMEILSETREGFWVTGVSGWWIGLDPSNREFSAAASGLWIEWGKVVKPVSRVTISAPLTELFGAVDAVGNDLIVDSTMKTPTYRVSEMTVSGT